MTNKDRGWIAGAFVLLALGQYGLQQSALDKAEEARVAQCEIDKADRLDTARVFTRLEKYYGHIATNAPSVQSDVTDVAAEVRVIVGESANQMRTRLIDCKEFAKDGDKVIDQRAVDEAQGDL